MFHCRGQLSGINGVLRPGIVHRIDKDTTGVLVVCKTDLAHRSLAEQLAVHSITRKYRAIAYGLFKEDAFTVEGNIGAIRWNVRKWQFMSEMGNRLSHMFRFLKG